MKKEFFSPELNIAVFSADYVATASGTEYTEGVKNLKDSGKYDVRSVDFSVMNVVM